MKRLAAVGMMFLLSGCSYITALGDDGSRLRVTQSCEVELKQHAAVGGSDKASSAEIVKVTPDCTTEIDFRQNIEEESISEAVGDLTDVVGQ